MKSLMENGLNADISRLNREEIERLTKKHRRSAKDCFSKLLEYHNEGDDVCQVTVCIGSEQIVFLYHLSRLGSPTSWLEYSLKNYLRSTLESAHAIIYQSRCYPYAEHINYLRRKKTGNSSYEIIVNAVQMNVSPNIAVMLA